MLDEKHQDRVTTKGSTEKWTSFKGTVSKTAKEVLGVKTRTYEDWFDKNDEKIKETIHAKNKSYIEWLNDSSSVSKFKAFRVKVQTDLRAMQDQWWLDRAAEVQHYADTHNAKKFFGTLKTVLAALLRAAPHYCRQTGRRSSSTRRVSASVGGSTSALCLIGPHQLTQTPWSRSPNSPYELRSQNPLPSRRSRRRPSVGKTEVLHQPAPYSHPLLPPSPLKTNHLPT